ncbi:MAG: hypothetical protein IPN92_17445 [Chromatiaceae bacterium]|nr:hypothetical protein [Chromatiaceae bacterium]
MLDVIAGAMAAFLILMVILLPYYGKETVNQEEIIAELRQAVAEAEAKRAAAESAAEAAQALAAQAQAKVESLEAQLSQTQADLEAAKSELSQTQAALAAAETQAREARAEVERLRRIAEDLAKQVKSGITPNLILYVEWFSSDVVDLIVMKRENNETAWYDWPPAHGNVEPRRNGGKSSIWLNVQYRSGDLGVDVKLSAMVDTHKPVKVWGRVYHPDGFDEFQEVQLSREGQRESMATFRVDETGGVRVTPW